MSGLDLKAESGSETGAKKYAVRLSEDERASLEAMISKGKRSAREIVKTRILLKADVSEAGEGKGWSDERIVQALATSLSTIYRTRQRLVEEGLDAALQRKPREHPSIPRIFDGGAEARLIQLACSEAPAGFARWTLRLLEEKVVELGIVPRASDNTPATTRQRQHDRPDAKKNSQAASEGPMGHPAGCQRGVRGEHGGCAGGLHPAA